MRIAIIGGGEVGLIYTTALLDHGHAVALCDPKPRAKAIDFST